MVIKRKKLVKSLCLSSMPILLCGSNKGCGGNKENKETQLVKAVTGSTQKQFGTIGEMVDSIVEKCEHLSYKPLAKKTVQYATTYKENIKNLLEYTQKLKKLLDEAKKSEGDAVREQQLEERAAREQQPVIECAKRSENQAKELLIEIEKVAGQNNNSDKSLSTGFKRIEAASSDPSTQKAAREIADLWRELERIGQKIYQDYNTFVQQISN